jgi:hypothetical protein
MRGPELGGGYPALDEPGGARRRAGLLPGLSMSRRREFGRQWYAFMAAWRPEVPAR